MDAPHFSNGGHFLFTRLQTLPAKALAANNPPAAPRNRRCCGCKKSGRCCDVDARVFTGIGCHGFAQGDEVGVLGQGLLL